jgi:tetratricopeptide (TPR) repeat protein
VPTLIVVGEHDIADVHAHAGAIQVGVPDARRIVVPASGHGVPVERPEPLSLQVLEHLQNRGFLTVLSNQGADAAAGLLRSARRANPAAVLVSEEELNQRGYERLQAGDKAGAVAILRLGVEAFPASANTHDSLGEALLASGEREAATAAYRRALEIDPESPSARGALSALEAPPAQK